MRRYKFLGKEGVFAVLNKLRASFLAAKDGNEVDKLIKGLLTYDERMKIGRRIQIAYLLKAGMKYREIMGELKVGLPTIMQVSRKIDEYPEAFELVIKRENKVESAFKSKSYHIRGGSKMIFKRGEYTGLTRKDVKR